MKKVYFPADICDLGQEGFEDSDRIHVDTDNALIIKNLTFADSGKCVPFTILV